MRRDVQWRDAVKNAEAYKAIGETTVYLERGPLDSYPWELAVRVADGAGWRMDIPVSITFEADHACGLTFLWFWDLELREANGKSGYHIDLPGIVATLARLEGTPAGTAFLLYLQRAADVLEKTAREALEFARGQYGQERLLRVLIVHVPLTPA